MSTRNKNWAIFRRNLRPFLCPCDECTVGRLAAIERQKARKPLVESTPTAMEQYAAKVRAGRKKAQGYGE